MTGARDLTLVTNNAGSGETDVAALLRERRVRKMICSYPRSAGSVWFERLYGAGEIELELVPQGTLSERIRTAERVSAASPPLPGPTPRSLATVRCG